MPHFPTGAEIRALGATMARAGLLVLAVAACAGAVNAEERGRAIALSTDGGFARLVVAYRQEVKTAPELVGGVLSIPMPRTAAVPVDQLQRRLAGYVRAAERDREALRLTLAPGVTANVMAAGEKLFVDLLPQSWIGLPPSLPPSVIDALARKAGQRSRAIVQARPSVPVAPPVAPVAITPSMPKSIAPAPVTAEVVHENDSPAILLPFATPTNVALFRLGDALWLVLDTRSAIDISALGRDSSRRLRDAELVDLAEGRALRIPLQPGESAEIATRGTGLVLAIGETMATSRVLLLDRQLTRDGLASAFVLLTGAGRALRLHDPGSGEEIIAVTAALPARGLPREQSFIDFRLLQSSHGLALVPRADDLSIEIMADGIAITRPGGLRLTGDGTVASIPPDTQIYGALSWQVDRAARFRQREAELTAALAVAASDEQRAARLALARFYLANGLGAEAKGILDAASEQEATRDPAIFKLRGLALLLLGRPGEAADELAGLAGSSEATLIRSAALADAGRFAEAREAYRAGASALATLPALLQRMVRMAMLHAAIELDQVDEANVLLHALESREPPGTIEPHLAVLAARVAGRLGRAVDAEKFLSIAERSRDEAAAAEARLRRVELAMAANQLDRVRAAERLRALVQSWRGDATEVAARRLLEKIQAAEAPSRSSAVNRPLREAAAIP